MLRTTITWRSMIIGWSLLIGIWCLVSYVLDVPEYLLSSPESTFTYFHANLVKIGAALGLTASQAIVGWLAAVILGVAAGAVIFYMPWGRYTVLPPLVALQTTPIIALAPLVTFWFGYGWLAKMVVACITAIFPVVIATYSGLGEAKPTHVFFFKLANANWLKIFWQVRLHSAWPAILPSLKVSIVFAVIGSIVAEFMGGNNGIGFLIMKAIYSSKGDLLMTAVICSALLGQVLLIILEKLVSPWEKRVGS